MKEFKHTIHETAQQWQAVALQTLTRYVLCSAIPPHSQGYSHRGTLLHILFSPPLFFYCYDDLWQSSNFTLWMLTWSHSWAVRSGSKSGLQLSNIHFQIETVSYSISSGRVASAAFNCSRLSDCYTEPRECSIWVTSFGGQSNWRYSQLCET